MAIVAIPTITPTTTAAQVPLPNNGHATVPLSVVMKVPAGSSNILLVGGTSGAVEFPVAIGDSFIIDVYSGEEIWYKSAASTTTLNILYNRA